MLSFEGEFVAGVACVALVLSVWVYSVLREQISLGEVNKALKDAVFVRDPESGGYNFGTLTVVKGSWEGGEVFVCQIATLRGVLRLYFNKEGELKGREGPLRDYWERIWSCLGFLHAGLLRAKIQFCDTNNSH